MSVYVLGKFEAVFASPSFRVYRHLDLLALLQTPFFMIIPPSHNSNFKPGEKGIYKSGMDKQNPQDKLLIYVKLTANQRIKNIKSDNFNLMGPDFVRPTRVVPLLYVSQSRDPKLLYDLRLGLNNF